MWQVLSTDPLPPRDRFSFWRDTVAELAMAVDVYLNHEGDFRATIGAASLGAVELLTMRHRPLEVDRTRKPALRGLTIQAVAARWAFTQGAHFSRAFKQAYGVSPQAYRDRGPT